MTEHYMDPTMFLTDLLAWGLMHIGILYLVTESVIFTPVRVLLARLPPHSAFASMIIAGVYCPACVGFWMGFLENIVLHVEIWPTTTLFLDDSYAGWRWPRAFATAVAGMGLGAIWATGRESLGRVYEIEQGSRLAIREAAGDEATTSEEGRSGEPRADGDG